MLPFIDLFALVVIIFENFLLDRIILHQNVFYIYVYIILISIMLV